MIETKLGLGPRDRIFSTARGWEHGSGNRDERGRNLLFLFYLLRGEVRLRKISSMSGKENKASQLELSKSRRKQPTHIGSTPRTQDGVDLRAGQGDLRTLIEEKTKS